MAKICKKKSNSLSLCQFCFSKILTFCNRPKSVVLVFDINRVYAKPFHVLRFTVSVP